MKNKVKKLISLMLAVVVLVAMVPAGKVEAKSPAKLSAKDFVFTGNGEKTDFIEMSKNSTAYYGIWAKDVDSKIGFKTNRGIKFGSTAATVKKKYGSAEKKTFKTTETAFKNVKYKAPGYDYSTWKSYLEYSYKNGSDTYKIRFYLNKNNKVEAVFYLKNLKNFYKYPNKQFNYKSAVTLKAPTGKKITTKTIDGKKVLMVPKGTKFVSKYADNFNYCMIYQIGTDGNVKAQFDGAYFISNYSNGKDYNCTLDTMLADCYTDDGYLNSKKLGKYKYFVLEVWDQNGKYAPSITYFKFK